MLKNWNLFEIVWLSVFSTIAIIITVITQDPNVEFLTTDSLISFFALITGILCVVLAAKGSLWTYIYGMFATFSYAYVAYQNNLFGEVGLNLIFFTPMNVVGFVMWKKKMNEQSSTVKMRGLSIRNKIITLLICITSTLILGRLLQMIPEQNTPYIDATTNVLSVVATILMVLRFKEQWLLYITLNIVTIMMWYLRYINGSSDGPIMVVMWIAFLVNAVYGYYKWNKNAISEDTV
ncbi:MAG: nicotinamide mononucleotide transporter [Desulfobacterales bacterium]|nr:nicotinamide mononucleotide transporter [Desulfobacterales bacterium]